MTHHRPLAALALGAALAALAVGCSSEPTAPALRGTYRLVTVDGYAVPDPRPYADGQEFALNAGALTLGPGYAIRTLTRRVRYAPPETMTRRDSLPSEQRGRRLLLRNTGGNGEVWFDTLTASADGATLETIYLLGSVFGNAVFPQHLRFERE